MARGVCLEMPEKPEHIPADRYQWGYFSAYQDVALGNQPHAKAVTYSWTDKEFAKGYRDAVGAAIRERNYILGIPNFFGGNRKEFNAMEFYGRGV